MATPDVGLCSVCQKNQAIGVAAVPFMPYSDAYCRECLHANAHPWWALVANTACCGGFDQTNKDWQQMVTDTCAHLGKSLEQFKEEVAKAMLEMEQEPPR